MMRAEHNHIRLSARFPNRIAIERRIRIRLCIAAFAYEIKNNPIMTDAEFDALALRSDSSILTGRHDEYWQNEFKPHTGSWIHSHPDLTGLERIYERNRL